MALPLGAIGAGMGVIGGLTGVIGGFGKRAEGRRMQRLAEQAIRDFEWQELTNPYKNLSISTAGADFRRDEAARASATATRAAMGGGARGIAALGNVVAATNDVNRDIAANLDEQQRSIDMMAAKDETRIQAMTETRQANELAGYGQMMNIGMGIKHQGVANIAQGLMGMGAGMGNLGSQLTELGGSTPS